MGYYTNFDISIYEKDQFPEGKSLDYDDAEKIFDSLTRSSDMEYAYLEESTKWYDYDKDVRSLSIAYPDHVFLAHGDGEESGDNWKEVFYNGKSTSVSSVLVFPPMNLSKIGLSDPSDPTPPKAEPENAYFFAEE